VKYPHIHIEVLPTLENEPALEDVLVDRLAPYLDDGRPLPSDGRAIERRSYEIIDARLKDAEPSDPASRAIIRRIIHATADFSFARTLRIHPQAVERGTSALAAGRPVICDVAMLQAAVTKVRGEVLCAISDPAAIRAAQEQVCTRAAAAMEHLAARLEGAIVAIGNAPTALWKIMEIVRRGGPKPALVAGLPVGFVGARESKLALIESGLCYITNTNARGGSPAAAAAVNALAITAEEWRNKDE
jgi:precorrin-8X/cobalt-precorrin-8 methylmutase